MDINAIKKALEARHWTVDLIPKEHAPDLVEIEPNGLLKCVDGRVSDQSEPGQMRGPKMLGGIYAIASIRGVTEAGALAKIVEEVKDKGYVPSVHGDDHKHAMGCGYFKLWKDEMFDGCNSPKLSPPQFSGEEGKEAVQSAGGKYETLQGEHLEKVVKINFVENTTFEPKGDAQRFIVDAWVASKFGLDLVKYLTLAAKTVEELDKKLRKAELIYDPSMNS